MAFLYLGIHLFSASYADLSVFLTDNMQTVTLKATVEKLSSLDTPNCKINISQIFIFGKVSWATVGQSNHFNSFDMCQAK